MSTQHTPGPWVVRNGNEVFSGSKRVCHVNAASKENLNMREDRLVSEANARLIAAAPTQHAEMLRYLPVLERAESDPELWARLTEGLGIATLNGYRAAIAKATGVSPASENHDKKSP